MLLILLWCLVLLVVDLRVAAWCLFCLGFVVGELLVELIVLVVLGYV